MKGKTGKKLAPSNLVPQPHGPQDMDAFGKGRKHGGKVEGKACGGRADKRARGGSIKIKSENKGKLHEDTKTPKGKKIPEAKLEKAEKSKDPAVKKRAVFAENAKHWG